MSSKRTTLKRKFKELEKSTDDVSTEKPRKRAKITQQKDNADNNKENIPSTAGSNSNVDIEEKKSDNDIFDGKDPWSYTVSQLKDLCRKKQLKVGGNKTTLIERLSNPNAISSKKSSKSSKSQSGQTSKRLSTKKVHEMLKKEGVSDPESVSNCLKKGIQRGYYVIDPDDDGLDAIIYSGSCICCSKTYDVSIRDLLYQPDYGGNDYEDGGEDASIQCDDCCGLYVTGLCEGKPSFDSGKFHNHCNECPGFGKCIGDYREAHCSSCNKHYFQGLSGFGCDNCERRAGRGGGGYDDDCIIQ